MNSLPDRRQFPTVNVDSYKRIGPSANNIWLAPTTTIAFAPTLTAVRGKHGLKFGLTIAGFATRTISPSIPAGPLASTAVLRAATI